MILIDVEKVDGTEDLALDHDRMTQRVNNIFNNLKTMMNTKEVMMRDLLNYRDILIKENEKLTQRLAMYE